MADPSPASPPPPPPPQPAALPSVESTDVRQLVLVKGGRRTAFACPPGGELHLLQQLRELVADPHSDLTWFDAAVLSHHLGERMSLCLGEQFSRKRVG